MRIGVYLPQIGAAATAEQVTLVARSVEETGFDSLWALDHVVLREDYGTPYPYSEDGRLAIPTTANFVEPLTILTYAAAVTERVELGTAVLVLPMRAPVLHAKVIASLDHLAGGRVILGAGVGWWKEEFEALSMPFDRRGKRMDEYLAVLRDLWTNDFGTFAGKFYDTTGWACNPKPPRHVPIWLGGNNPAQLRRVGRFADGWLPNPNMLDTLESDFDRARQAASDVGRDPSKLQLAMNRVALLREGGLSEAADTLASLRARGVDHAVVNLHPAEDPRALLESFATDYLSALQD